MKGNVLRSEEADKVAFNFKPKPFQINASEVAKDFVEREKQNKSGFQVSDIVSEAAGIEDIRRRNLEAAVEETVLQRMKDIEEQAYRQAYDLGMIEGEKRAFDDKKADLEARLAQFDELLQKFNDVKVNLLQQNEVHLMHLVFKIAEKIAMHEVIGNKESIANFIRQVTESLAVDDRVNVHVSKDDFTFIEETRAKLEKQSGTFEKVKLISEADMTPGGCVIESNFGTIDATVEQRVAKVWEAIHSKFPLLKGQAVNLPIDPAKPDDGGTKT
jgi:flagellar assembly protein FliH